MTKESDVLRVWVDEQPGDTGFVMISPRADGGLDVRWRGAPPAAATALISHLQRTIPIHLLPAPASLIEIRALMQTLIEYAESRDVRVNSLGPRRQHTVLVVGVLDEDYEHAVAVFGAFQPGSLPVEVVRDNTVAVPVLR